MLWESLSEKPLRAKKLAVSFMAVVEAEANQQNQKLLRPTFLSTHVRM
jgi:hypothetical protein